MAAAAATNSLRPAEASQLRCAYALRLPACCACTYISLLTIHYKLAPTATVPLWPRVHTIPGPFAPAYRVPTGVRAAVAPAQRAVDHCHRAPMHALTAHSYPRRWLYMRRHRRQRQRLNVYRALGRYRARCHGLHPLCGPLRSPDRGAHRHAYVVHAMHTHAYNHPLILMNRTVTGPTLPQPCRVASTDLCDLAYCVSQVVRPPQGRCKAAARRCSGGHLSSRSGRCGSCRSLCARAGGRRPRCRIGQHRRCARDVLAAARSAHDGHAAASVVPPSGACVGAARVGRPGSPGRC